jgi:hypothetical protein
MKIALEICSFNQIELFVPIEQDSYPLEYGLRFSRIFPIVALADTSTPSIS